jgi:flagellar hook-associated protein 3 FlgL
MRVTSQMVLRSTVSNLNHSLERLQSSQTQLSTGRAIRKVSDDPTGASSAMSLRGQLRRSEQYQRALTDAKGWLGTADSAVVSGLDLLNRVKELTVRASNAGVSNAASRAGIANEVAHLRDELLALANTEYLGRPVFNGAAAGPAYDAGAAYVGDTATVVRDLGPGLQMDVNLTGPAVFGDPSAPGGDLFAVLDRLQVAIATGDQTAIAAEHDLLDAGREQMSIAAAQIGARGARLEGIETRLAADEETLRVSLSEIEDADLAEALISVKARENAYMAALQAASQVIPPSLVDYLR